jgi:hypothetical protein
VIPAHFSIHRFTTDVEELDEESVARLVGGDAEFVGWLGGLDSIEGALVIGDASILDDLASATRRLCFEAVAVLAAPGTAYAYPYFTSNTHAELSSADGASISLSGDDIPALTFSRAELLPALHACGMRFLVFLEELGRRGRPASAAELAHLSPFAERSKAALAAQGLA